MIDCQTVQLSMISPPRRIAPLLECFRWWLAFCLDAQVALIIIASGSQMAQKMGDR